MAWLRLALDFERDERAVELAVRLKTNRHPTPRRSRLVEAVKARRAAEEKPFRLTPRTVLPTKPTKDTSNVGILTKHPLDCEWVLVRDDAGFEEALRAVSQAKVVYADFETVAEDKDAAEKVIPWRMKPRLFSIYTGRRKVYILDLFALGDAAGRLRRLFEVGKDKLWVFHNAAFDLAVWREAAGTWAEIPSRVWDTMIFERLVQGTHARRPTVPGPSLASVVKKYLDLELSKDEQASDWNKTELSQSQLEYAARDAAVLLHVYRAQRDALLRAGWKRDGLDLLCVWLVEHVRLETSLKRYYRVNPRYTERVEELRKAVDKRGEDFARKWGFKYSQNRKIVERLRKFGVEVDGFNKTAKAELVKMIEAGKLPPDAVDLVIEAIELGKIKKEFDLLAGYVAADPARIIVGACGASTGRYVCRNPNLLQIPRQYKKDLLVPPPGFVFIRADFPGQEIRIVAHFAKEEKMREVLVDGKHGGDLHRRTASALFGKDEVSKEERQVGKGANFLLVYGGSPRALYRTLKQQGADPSLEDCERWHAAFFSLYQGIADWHRRIRRIYYRNDGQFWVYTPGGRSLLAKAPSKEEWDKDTTLKRNRGEWTERKALAEGLKRAFNYHGQATGFDIAALAMVKIRVELARRGWLDAAFPVLLIHDELVYCVREDLRFEVADIVRAKMEEAMDELLPFVKGGNAVPEEDVLFVYEDGRVETLEEARKGVEKCKDENGSSGN
ncbi:DNA polymerase [Thermosulfurimonas sp. F29]|uniref:DNA polymerase n=1 Tax=Thermosulfurimonas sp. F29 TaxID=2867247 RepID=UPI001C82CFB8|nr:DNA polymerase [Thermosulfurimonas sp. F29]MBX6423795.1 hypothetical protein [Thermosulfurimonas sp. F29]